MPGPSLFHFRHGRAPVPDWIGLDPAIHQKQGNRPVAEVEYTPCSVIAKSVSDEAIHSFLYAARWILYAARWIASLRSQ
jgi:hypothetical protein